MNTVLKLAAAALLLSGCASITKGTTQNIAFDVEGPTSAECILSGGVKKTITIPTVVKVDKSSEAIIATCNAEGYEERKQVIDSSAEAMSAGNMVFGGVIGLGVDAATGAMFKYPTSVLIYMKKLAEGSTDTMS